MGKISSRDTQSTAMKGDKTGYYLRKLVDETHTKAFTGIRRHGLEIEQKAFLKK